MRTTSDSSHPEAVTILFTLWSAGAYLSCQVQSWGLWEGTVNLPQHPAQLGHHGPEIIEEGSNRLIKYAAHCLEGGGGGAVRQITHSQKIRHIHIYAGRKNCLTSTTSESCSHLLRMVWINVKTCCSTTTTWNKKIKYLRHFISNSSQFTFNWDLTDMGFFRSDVDTKVRK